MARTTHRSSAGRKLYADRDKEGQFKDIQSYKLAHGSDVRRDSNAERLADQKAAKKKTATRKTATRKAAARKTTAKRPTAKKAVRKK